MQGILVQNTEAISDALWSCFESSSSAFVKNLFPSSSRAESSSLLSVRGPGDVNFVLSLVMPTRLHFVHCIAPNTQGHADFVDGNVMLLQIIASGMLGTGLLRGKGYLCNASFDEFVQRYGVLANPRPRKRQNVTANECSRLLKSLLSDLNNDKLVCVGATRVFLTHAAFRVLEAKRSSRLREAAATIASITLRRRFLLRVSDLLAQKAPKRAAKSPTPRRNLPALPSNAAAAAQTVTLGRGSGLEAAVDLTRGAIALVRLLYKDPIQRGEIVQKLKELKTLEDEFREMESNNTMQDEGYAASVDVVLTALGLFCENVRGVCRSNDNKPALLKECKSSHNDLVMAIRSWKSEYSRISAVSGTLAKSPRVSMQRPPTAAAVAKAPAIPLVRVASEGVSASSPGTRRPAPSPITTRGPTVPDMNQGSMSPRRTTTMSVSPRLSGISVSPMSSPRGQSNNAIERTTSSSSSATTGPASAGANGGLRIVFHDSPKQKRKAHTREIMSKIVSGGGSVKETLDKLDSELGIKGV
jgi:hypothetical protein